MADNGLHNETTKVDPNYDVEAGGGGGGAALGRQISVQLTPEQFERLYLQPGGQAAKGDLAKRFGNPTPLGVVSFLLCLTPFSCELMGWRGSTTAAAATTVGAFYYIGGVGLYISGLLEWIIGNTFPATVFMSFGGFWFAFGFLLRPDEGIAASFVGASAATTGANAPDYNLGIGIYLIWWALVTFVYLIASLRTNVVFVLLFFFLELTFDLLVALYFRLAVGNVVHVESYLKAAGAFGFLTAAMGWYLLMVLVWGSTGIPLALPVGDLSGFLSGKAKNA